MKWLRLRNDQVDVQDFGKKLQIVSEEINGI
jgi:hypothetical protein